MTTPQQIIERLYEDFDCQLSEERILELMSSLEAHLCRSVLRQTQVTHLAAPRAVCCYTLPFAADKLVRVTLSGRELYEGDGAQDGYRLEGNTLFLCKDHPDGTLYFEHLRLPEKLTRENYHDRTLILPDGYEEIYLYHVLSRAALMQDDIERLNNYSAIYQEALRRLSRDQLQNHLRTRRYRNIW